MDTPKSQPEDSNFSGPSEASSATGVFGIVSPSGAHAASEDDSLKSLLSGRSASAEPAPAQETLPIAPEVTPASPIPAGPGEFTRTFQALKPDAETPAPPAPTAQKPAADLTSVFTPVNLNKPVSSAPAVAGTQPPASRPGEFTELLQTLTRPVVEPAPQQTSVPAMETAESAPTKPGSFTQMFQTLSSEKPSASPAPPPVKEPAATGGFTQLFQSLSSGQAKEPAPPEPEPQKSAPGSFTQMFQQLNPQAPSQSDPFASLKPEPASEQSAVNFYGSRPSKPEPAVPAQGGFTQLFQALGNEDTPQKSQESFAPLQPPAADAAPPAAGGFTQLLRTLNAEPAPQPSAPPVVAPSQAPPAQSSMPSSSGPGEFTRIISGSMLRETQQAQGGAASGPPVMPPAAPSGGGQPAFQMPPMPKVPQPVQAQMPMHGGGGAAPQMPHFQPSAFPFPQPPAMPAPTPPAPSKLQQYLPLILVLNVFVLIVVVLIVVFALRHH